MGKATRPSSWQGNPIKSTNKKGTQKSWKCSHSNPFASIRELVENARDKQNSTLLKVDAKADADGAITDMEFLDNGHATERPGRLGEFGEGFNLASASLAEDVFVFTKNKDAITQYSVLRFGFTLNRHEDPDGTGALVSALVCLAPSKKHNELRITDRTYSLYNNSAFFSDESPYENTEDLEGEFDKIPETGTLIASPRPLRHSALEDDRIVCNRRELRQHEDSKEEYPKVYDLGVYLARAHLPKDNGVHKEERSKDGKLMTILINGVEVDQECHPWRQLEIRMLKQPAPFWKMSEPIEFEWPLRNKEDTKGKAVMRLAWTSPWSKERSTLEYGFLVHIGDRSYHQALSVLFQKIYTRSANSLHGPNGCFLTVDGHEFCKIWDEVCCGGDSARGPPCPISDKHWKALPSGLKWDLAFKGLMGIVSVPPHTLRPHHSKEVLKDGEGGYANFKLALAQAAYAWTGANHPPDHQAQPASNPAPARAVPRKRKIVSDEDTDGSDRDPDAEQPAAVPLPPTPEDDSGTTMLDRVKRARRCTVPKINTAPESPKKRKTATPSSTAPKKVRPTLKLVQQELAALQKKQAADKAKLQKHEA
eukprot:jgi/Chlat1/7495/Chrsp61S07004